MSSLFPIDEPTDESCSVKRRMPGKDRVKANPREWDMGVVPRVPAPEGSPRTLEDVVRKHGLPMKPPGRR